MPDVIVGPTPIEITVPFKGQDFYFKLYLEGNKLMLESLSGDTWFGLAEGDKTGFKLELTSE